MKQDKEKKKRDTMKRPLKYKGYTISFQEVPDEISLILNICGCQNHCNGCHSKYLWGEEGGKSIKKDLPFLINKYKDLITCVCFMGGDQNQNELFEICKYVKERKLNCCVYSGIDFLNDSVLSSVDYYKIGHYDENLGGLDSLNTNQKFYKIKNQKELIDITKMFQTKKY